MIKNLIYILLFLISCNGKEVVIESFNQEVWKNDPFGCTNSRLSEAESLLQNKEQLMGMNNDDLIQLLGKPDRTELYTRNQKFFHYYLTPGEQCTNVEESADPARLTFRFNATGFINEVTLYD